MALGRLLPLPGFRSQLENREVDRNHVGTGTLVSGPRPEDLDPFPLTSLAGVCVSNLKWGLW